MRRSPRASGPAASTAARRRRPSRRSATYDPDYLTNYEIGYKTSWLDNHLRFNGAFFWEDWKNFQFGFLGQNSFTIVRNAGSARIKGAEQQLEWTPMRGLNLSLGATELDAKLSKDFCIDVDPNTGGPLPIGPAPPAGCPFWDAVPSGTQLPIVPKFKTDATVRYSFPLGGDMEGHVQGSFAYQTATNSQLAPYQNALIGEHARLRGAGRPGRVEQRQFLCGAVCRQCARQARRDRIALRVHDRRQLTSLIPGTIDLR